MLTTHETIAPVAATELMAPALVDRIQRRAVMVADSSEPPAALSAGELE